MKKLKFAAIAAVCFIGLQASAQFSFGVAPGISLNTAYFGYSVNDKIMPYFALQFYNGTANMVQSGQRMDPFTGQLENFEEESDVSVSLLIPTLGVKYYAIERDELRGYFNLNFSKPLIFGKAEFEGTSDPYFEEQIDAISFWGGEVGFGTEYFFSEAFSVGGEFGLRWIRMNDEVTTTSEYFDPNTGAVIVTEETSDIAVNFSPTYSRISLNFYFN